MLPNANLKFLKFLLRVKLFSVVNAGQREEQDLNRASSDFVPLTKVPSAVRLFVLENCQSQIKHLCQANKMLEF